MLIETFQMAKSSNKGIHLTIGDDPLTDKEISGLIAQLEHCTAPLDLELYASKEALAVLELANTSTLFIPVVALQRTPDIKETKDEDEDEEAATKPKEVSEIEYACAHALRKLLIQNQTIETLFLSLPDHLQAPLIDAVKDNTRNNIQEIKFNHDKFVEEWMTEEDSDARIEEEKSDGFTHDYDRSNTSYFSLLKNSQSLRIIDFKILHNDLLTFKTLKENKKLQFLQPEGLSNLSSESLCCLTELILNDRIKVLNLAAVLHSSGRQLLFSCLSQLSNSSLETLTIGLNPPDEIEFGLFLQYLKNNMTLKDLFVGTYNGFKEEQLVSLFSALANNPKSKVSHFGLTCGVPSEFPMKAMNNFNLYDRQGKKQVAASILDWLEKSKTLEYAYSYQVILCVNDPYECWEPSTKKRFYDIISTHPSIRSIYLNYQLLQGYEENLLSALKRNKNIVDVSFTLSAPIDFDPLKPNIKDLAEKQMLLNQKLTYQDNYNWGGVATTLAFEKANPTSPLRFSILPLLPSILGLAGFEPEPAAKLKFDGFTRTKFYRAELESSQSNRKRKV